MSLKTPKIFLISPREPCGATWLINCLLVLGVKTYRTTVGDDMWVRSGSGWTLNPIEMPLKKWLPALGEAQRFSFRDGIEVEWAHIWPTSRVANAKIIYFIRDPRDALFSRYRRESPDVTFREFLDFPDAQTHLDKIETWNLFNEVWLLQPNLMVFRFEDYKQDALATLRGVLDFLDIFVSESSVFDAVARSGFEQAVAAEKRYRELHPEDTQVINRASQVGSWKDPSLSEEVTEIAKRCGGLMSRFGYLPVPERDVQLCSYLPHSGSLRFYRSLNVPVGFWDRSNDGREQVRVIATVTLAMKMNAVELGKYRLQPYEQWQLLCGLQEFIRVFGERISRRLSVMQAESSAVPNLVWRINEFLSLRGIRLPRYLKSCIWKLARLGKVIVFKEFR